MNNTSTNPGPQPQRPDDINPFSQPLYPSISSPTPGQTTNPFHQTSANHTSTQESQPHFTSISASIQKETGPCSGNQTPTTPAPSSSSPKTQQREEVANPSCSTPSSQPPIDSNDREKWGTHVMGHPAIPTCHPDNKKAAFWGAGADQAHSFHYPYVQYNPIEKSSSNSPVESILHVFNSWSNKAESLANNIWRNRKHPRIKSTYI